MRLINEYDNFIIFLDDDNRTVKMQALALKRELELLSKGKVTIHHSQGTDPKEYSDGDLEALLYDIKRTYFDD